MRSGQAHQGPAAAGSAAAAHRAAGSVQTGLGLGLGLGLADCGALSTTIIAATALTKAKTPGIRALLGGRGTQALVLIGIGIQTTLGTTLPKPSKQVRGGLTCRSS